MNMQFVDKRNRNMVNNVYNNNTPQMPFSRNSLKAYLNNTVIDIPTNDDNAKKMRWGAPTWYFLHSLASKIRPEMFDSHKNEIFQVIKAICNNLPCPICANHATEYMNKINFDSLRTPDDLKNMLFKFHNDVNVRKNVPLFDYEQHNVKYIQANMKNISRLFITVFQEKSKNIHQIANNMHRDRVINKLKKWIFENIHLFNE
jgi:hypothetical protein